MHGTYVALRRSAIPAILALVAVAASLSVPAGAAGGRSPSGLGFQGESGTLPNLDLRPGQDVPTRAQRVAARRLGDVMWNNLGTPQVVIDHAGALGIGPSGRAVAVARNFLAANQDAFGLTAGEVSDLAVLGVNRIGRGRAVLLGQRFEGLAAGRDGLAAVAVIDGDVAFVSTSLSEDTRLAGAPTIAPEQAFAVAARNVGLAGQAGSVHEVAREGGWTTLRVAGLADPQRIRLTAVPMPDGPARPAYQTLVTDTDDSVGYAVFVDAASGDLLLRGEPGRLRRGRPDVGSLPGLPVPRLLLDRHARGLVPVRDGSRLRHRVQQPLHVARRMGRRCGLGDPDLPDPGEQRPGHREVELDDPGRVRPGNRLLILRHPRLRLPVDESVVRGLL